MDAPKHAFQVMLTVAVHRNMTSVMAVILVMMVMFSIVLHNTKSSLYLREISVRLFANVSHAVPVHAANCNTVSVFWTVCICWEMGSATHQGTSGSRLAETTSGGAAPPGMKMH